MATNSSNSCAFGLVDVHQQAVIPVENQMRELLSEQESVIKILEQERQRNVCSEKEFHIDEFQAMVEKTRVYLEKINRIKFTMTTLTQKTSAIKERAINLQNETVSSMVKKEEVRNKRREFEKKLVAKQVKM
ncbi:uncharacterized protein LOC136032251 [Artemia franciscana]|uniref:BLOC-1 subunit 6 n=1 Tax=Artemia franciscana TaxID=6661 RepID=A0AA88IE60_ARTSF|nr:hypothetical protein QYM36_000202 [Artemia franciscana]KAK2725619.1 hypothetical protein QYM36_000202 [Artemia franciscana]